MKSFLYFLCILSSAYTIATPATLANQEPFFPESTITITITVQISSIDEFIDTIDENWYGGVYVKNDIYHILALPEYYEALVEKVEKEYSSSKTSCVVDFPDNAVIYSRSQIKTARAILEQQKENFHIIGVGNWIDMESDPVTNGLTIDIDSTIALTEELKNNIINCIGIEKIRFSSETSEGNPNTGAI